LALAGSSRFGAKGTGEVHAISTPAEAVGVLTGELRVPPAAADVEQLFARPNRYDIDFSDVRAGSSPSGPGRRRGLEGITS
jgi:hypothetical protein